MRQFAILKIVEVTEQEPSGRNTVDFDNSMRD